MNEKINFSGGEPTINFNDLNRNNIANRAALFAVMQAFAVDTNTNFIISGCVATVDTGVDVDVTAGYIFLNGEILQVEAQTVVDGGTLDLYKYVKSTTYDAGGDKTFNDSTARQTWEKNRGIVTAATTPILTTELDVVDGATLFNRAANRFITKELDIGDWDMLAATGAATRTISHGIADHTKIRRISVIVRPDDDAPSPTIYHDLNHKSNGNDMSAGVQEITNTSIKMQRTTGGFFDHADFDKTTFNRGWVTIDYLP